jgi:membrane protein required for colicin V production
MEQLHIWLVQAARLATQLNWVDWFLIGTVVFSFMLGLVRGFVFEMMALVGWIVAYFIALWLAPMLGGYLPIGQVGSTLNFSAGFVLSFISALLLWSLFARVLRYWVKASTINVLDRLMGCGFGLLRGLMVVLTITTVISLTPLNKSLVWRESKVAPLLGAVLHELRPFWLPAKSRFFTFALSDIYA